MFMRPSTHLVCAPQALPRVLSALPVHVAVEVGISPDYALEMGAELEPWLNEHVVNNPDFAATLIRRVCHEPYPYACLWIFTFGSSPLDLHGACTKMMIKRRKSSFKYLLVPEDDQPFQ